MSKEHDDTDIVPDTIYDNNTKTNYKKGSFLGKGGFGKCFQITDTINKTDSALKVISKKLLTNPDEKERVIREINIHKSIKHKHVVAFHNSFEDELNIYIILELCEKKSMEELLKRRKTITEPETRYYMKQILNGVNYLHSNNIIHRDLKLDNLFLNDDLQVKIGDFGLSVKLQSKREKRITACGTPSYVAPEVLRQTGHSFEVDIWSIGCIMYTLLNGYCPFDTLTLKGTLSKIKKCDYTLAASISASAKQMISSIFQNDPLDRPKVSQLINHEFLQGYTPSTLPASTLTMAPRYDQVEKNLRKPLAEICGNVTPSGAAGPVALHHHPCKQFDAKQNFDILKNMLAKVMQSAAAKTNVNLTDEMTDPAAQPIIWISKWIDYSKKYGFGYQLCDESVGVMFNDETRIMILPNGMDVQYIDKNDEETYMTVDNYPKMHDKNMKLLLYFKRYIMQHLVKVGATAVKENDTLSRIPHLHKWCRSASAAVMQLNNGTLQINFSDHTKIIMCPLMAAVTYIDEQKCFRTYKFETLEKNGCSKWLYARLLYADFKIEQLLQQTAK